jgi:hypothetical protein
MDFGCAEIARRVEGGYVAASDPRREQPRRLLARPSVGIRYSAAPAASACTPQRKSYLPRETVQEPSSCPQSVIESESRNRGISHASPHDVAFRWFPHCPQAVDGPVGSLYTPS